jgi:heme-degrading monooxygenase HmoA
MTEDVDSAERGRLQMIVRVFRAKIRPGKQADFELRVRDLSIPLVKSQKGLLAYFAGKPMESNPDEFVMVTIWRNLSDVEGFTGENWNRPIVLEEEVPFVEEALVHHYEVFGSSLSQVS